MSLRPVSARWFEVLTPRDDSARTVAVLAATGLVEVEIHRGDADVGRLEELEAGLGDYKALLGAYGRYWPEPADRSSARHAAPRLTIRLALRRLNAWVSEAQSVVTRLQAMEEQATQLHLWGDVLRCMEGSTINLRQVTQAGFGLQAVFALIPADAEVTLPAPLLYVQMPIAEAECLLVVGASADLQQVRQQIRALKGRVLERPTWLRSSTHEAVGQLRRRSEFLGQAIADSRAVLDDLNERFRVVEAVADLGRLEWFVSRVGALRGSSNFAWVTGWTSDHDGSRLAAAMEREGARGLLHFPEPPEGARPPMLLDNPRWVRPFEVFVRALGTPAFGEADPSPLLPIVVPLLFGYVFSDVGQGAVLCLLGVYLQRRWPTGRLLIVGGLAAVVFGVLFGSVFSREDRYLPCGCSHWPRQ